MLTLLSSSIPHVFLRFKTRPKINWKSDDYYERLGIPKSSTQSEIKKKYYEIVKSYHPDLLKTKEEKEEGQKILEAVNAAYDVLKDENSRRRYDQEKSSPKFGFGNFDFRKYSHPQRILRENVTVDFMESVFGCIKTIKLQTTETCNRCNGYGTKDGKEPTICEHCGGSGLITNGFFPMPCHFCGGKGFFIKNPCNKCGGTGQTPKPSKITLNIPPGINNGSVINYSTPNGHLIVRFNVIDSSIFNRDGNDLHVTVPISMQTAAIGGIVKIPTLKGILEKKVRPGTQPFDVEKLEGGGVNGIGSLFIHYKVIIPRYLSNNDKRLLKQMGDKYMKNTNDMFNENLKAFENALKKHKK